MPASWRRTVQRFRHGQRHAGASRFYATPPPVGSQAVSTEIGGLASAGPSSYQSTALTRTQTRVTPVVVKRGAGARSWTGNRPGSYPGDEAIEDLPQRDERLVGRPSPGPRSRFVQPQDRPGARCTRPQAVPFVSLLGGKRRGQCGFLQEGRLLHCGPRAPRAAPCSHRGPAWGRVRLRSRLSRAARLPGQPPSRSRWGAAVRHTRSVTRAIVGLLAAFVSFGRARMRSRSGRPHELRAARLPPRVRERTERPAGRGRGAALEERSSWGDPGVHPNPNQRSV